MENEKQNWVSLKEYIDMRFSDIEKKTITALANVHRSQDREVEQLDKRLEGMNQFRAQLTDQTNTFTTKVDYNHLSEKINKLEELRSHIVSLEVKFWILLTFALSSVGYMSAHLFKLL